MRRLWPLLGDFVQGRPEDLRVVRLLAGVTEKDDIVTARSKAEETN
jgi:hypothetical protein